MINGVTCFRFEGPSSTVSPRIGRLIFDIPGEKVNTLNLKVFDELQLVVSALERMGSENALDALIFMSGKRDQFIAGADIKLIHKMTTEAEAEDLVTKGHGIMNRWEDLPFPTIAAIEGPAMGGGCEVSLASTAIVMSSSSAARIALPEVMLGVLPGLGGCVRLPRKIGIAGALDMILTGKALNGERAAKAGLADASLPKENFQENVETWVRANIKALKARSRIAKEPKLGGMGGFMGKILEGTPFGRAFVYKKAREGVMSRTKGKYPAPLEILNVLQKNDITYGMTLSKSKRTSAQDRECEGFKKLAITQESKRLIDLFFLTEETKKLYPNAAFDCKQAAVLGAGVMGGGIAHLFADKKISIRMKDISNKGLETGIQQAMGIWSKDVKRRKLSPREMQQRLNRIAPVLDYSGFAKMDVVVEAVIEKMDLKKKVLAELETLVPETCVIATNTSSLSVSDMGRALRNPSRFVGMHFFNPVNKMPLVEVIRGDQSSEDAVSAIYQLSRKLGKTPIVVKDGPGFLVNRLLLPYLNEAGYLMAEGVPIPELDQNILDFGMPMGPAELIDEIGIDTGAKVLHIIHEGLGPRMAPTTLLDAVVKADYLGRKNGKGLYRYAGVQSRERTFDPKIYELCGVTPRPGKVSREDQVDRCILPMINEATRCLADKIVESPSVVDLGMIMGTGFPPFRGGLLRYADSLGAMEIEKRLDRLAKTVSPRFEPAPELRAMAAEGRTFY